jgi:hypothetical protein
MHPWVQDQVARVSLDEPRPARAILCNTGFEEDTLPPDLLCSSANASQGPRLSQPTNVELRGDLYVEQSSAELITRLHNRVGRTSTLDEVASLGSAWVTSARPRRERAHHQYQRECAPVSVGSARRRDKGRDWSFDIHWAGAPKLSLKRYLSRWERSRRTHRLFSSLPS